MMISPESYYEMNLKGKTTEQIMSAIRGLKMVQSYLRATAATLYRIFFDELQELLGIDTSIDENVDKFTKETR